MTATDMAQHDPDAPATEHLPDDLAESDLIPLRQDEEGDFILPVSDLADVVGLRSGDYLHFGVDKQDPEEPAITLEPVPEDPEIAPSANPEVRKVSERLDVYDDAPGQESLLAAKVPKFCLDDRGLDIDLDEYDGAENPLYLDPIVLRGAIILVPMLYADGEPYEPPTEADHPPLSEETKEDLNKSEEQIESGDVVPLEDVETDSENEEDVEEATGEELAWTSPSESEAVRTTAPIHGADPADLGTALADLQSAARDASLQGVMSYPPVTVDAADLETSVTVPGEESSEAATEVRVVIVDEDEFDDVADAAGVPDDVRPAAREAMEWAAEDVLAAVTDLSTDYQGFARQYTALVFPVE